MVELILNTSILIVAIIVGYCFIKQGKVTWHIFLNGFVAGWCFWGIIAYFI